MTDQVLSASTPPAYLRCCDRDVQNVDGAISVEIESRIVVLASVLRSQSLRDQKKIAKCHSTVA
jgi:hypothetical protein